MTKQQFRDFDEFIETLSEKELIQMMLEAKRYADPETEEKARRELASRKK
jgi:hypothetical protein